MLSDQMNGTFRRAQRQGAGNSMLGPMLQQGLFARTAPNVQRFNTNRQIGYRGMAPGSGYGEVGSAQTPTGAGSPHPFAALLGDGFGPPAPPQGQQPNGGISPLLAQLGMLLMAQQGQRQGQGGR